MSQQKIGAILDGLGVTIDLDDGDLVASAMTVAKIVAADGEVSLTICDSEGLSWIEQVGLLTAAQHIIQQAPARPRDED